MTVPSTVKGQYWDVVAYDPVDGLPKIICGLTTRGLTHSFQTAKEYLRDCGEPTMVPFGVVNVTGEDFDMSGTGVHNRAQGALIRSLAGKSIKYRFYEGEPGDDLVDHGYYEGNFVLSSYQVTAADGTNVTSQFTWVSDGQIIWGTGAESALAPLGLTPLVATANTLWTGTLTGKTTGSTITATSSDSVVLTVSASTITGTFTAAGSKTITITETLAGAINTPKVTTKTVVVS